MYLFMCGYMYMYICVCVCVYISHLQPTSIQLVKLQKPVIFDYFHMITCILL